MYHVIIIEDDPMVASINKQYVELTSSFHVEATFKNGILALQYLQNCTVCRGHSGIPGGPDL